MSISVREFETPPLVNITPKAFKNLFIKLHKKKNRIYPNQIANAKWPKEDSNGTGFIVTGNIDTKYACVNLGSISNLYHI